MFVDYIVKTLKLHRPEDPSHPHSHLPELSERAGGPERGELPGAGNFQGLLVRISDEMTEMHLQL